MGLCCLYFIILFEKGAGNERQDLGVTKSKAVKVFSLLLAFRQQIRYQRILV